MNIYTDASLNDKEKVAGVSAVFVPTEPPHSATCYNTYCSVSKIETAELFAIAMALSLIKPQSDKIVRVISDSLGALRKIQRIFHHPNQNQIKTIKDLTQQKIMYRIASSFSKVKEMDFSFCYVHGHQHKVAELTDAYYNAIADQEALLGRMNGEFIKQQERKTNTDICSFLSAEERMILEQENCPIVSPNNISFHYENLEKAKIVARRHPQKLSVRKAHKFCRLR